ncbi:MAG TPA: choline kinase [Cytophagales bacterium]|nr:choline kinase [Cytophagales bacterium]
MKELTQEVLALTGSSKILQTQSVQTLWSGYGEIVRYSLVGGAYSSVIVKHIRWPEEQNHPRGWNTSLSHQRKLKSYQVERGWYESYATRTVPECRVPQLYHSLDREGKTILIMEDLDASGFPLRHTPDSVSLTEVKSGLRWLAHFHATFLGVQAPELWPIGTYWHLDTRPEEWERMQNRPLKDAAKAIDERLNSAKYQTMVHGDAKLANFCFGEMGEVAAVDFQYVGRGCGMKDVAYFISSCLEEEGCERYETELLDYYFEQLAAALPSATNVAALQDEWRPLYRYAWADFYRFLDGWSPGHWKMHRYSERIAQEVLDEI